MENTKEFYDFVSDAWKFVKNTQAPAQDNNVAWEQIVDRSNELCTEFIHRMADWMEYLRNKSME